MNGPDIVFHFAPSSHAASRSATPRPSFSHSEFHAGSE
jgi:hypothetical protein